MFATAAMHRLWKQSSLLAALLLDSSLTVLAGPPFVTDDPEPVEYKHWEVYLASQLAHDQDGWSGTSPHVEVNYGAAPNLQLHVITPMVFAAPNHGSTQVGYGDTELGVKYRLVQETENRPQLGVFPLIEVPTGDSTRGLGSGHVQALLPLWIQKSWGEESRKWTTYGGGGYWINPGAGNHSWCFVGWLLQRQITSNLTLGAEAFHETAKVTDGKSDTRLNLGGIFDLSEVYHLLFSAGHTIQGPGGFQAYVAFQVTFGPGK